MQSAKRQSELEHMFEQAETSQSTDARQEEGQLDSLYESLTIDQRIDHPDWRVGLSHQIRGRMYEELEEMFENEQVQREAQRDRNFIESIQLYIGKMLKDKNQNNYHKSNPQTEQACAA
jgi:hypothetical protein